MNTRVRAAGLLACALLLSAGVRAQTPVDFTGAKQLADADEATVAGAQHDAMLLAQRAVLDAGIADCAQHQAREDFSPFVIVMRLDASGHAVQTWRQGDSTLGVCMQHYVRDRLVLVPPKVPFHTALEVSFEK